MQEKLCFESGDILDTVFPEFITFRGKEAFSAKIGGDIERAKALLTSPGEWYLRKKDGTALSLAEYSVLEALEYDGESALITIYMAKPPETESAVLKERLDALWEKYSALLSTTGG